MKRFLFILLAAVMIMGSTATAFAMDYPSDLPPIPEEYAEDLYIIYKFGDKTLLDIAFTDDHDNTYNVMYKPDSNLFRITGTNGFGLRMYELINGEWVFQSASAYYSTAKANRNLKENDIGYFIYSTHNIYLWETDELVFPLPPVPLAEEIRELTEETLTVETMPELTETVLVVVLCGVGCLALAISLPLLKKVLSRFLA